jgi:mono/diheme cytochrome c family protein
MARRVLAALLLVAVLVIAGLIVWSWHSEIAAIEPPAPSSFDTAAVARGAALAAAGNCLDCHTAPGGAPLAGGRAVATPFGTIYATNITPHPESGIGRWPEPAFRRALREGVDRQGRHLYPAFPYDHFTKLTDPDIGALYAYLMSVDPVAAATPPSRLPFPLDQRMLVAGWKLLFLERGTYRPDAAQSAEWNRGAYLAEGLAHCGACHTPRNALGAERRGARYGGGFSEGWYGPALNASQPAPVPWTAERLFNYLRTGFDPEHGAAAGPMAPVVRNLAPLPDSDIRAIAAYVTSTAAGAPVQRRPEAALEFARQQSYKPLDLAADGTAAGADGIGRTLFAGACASCHYSGGNVSFSRPVDLALSTAVNAPVPNNLIQVILHGVRPPTHESDPLMPPFGGALTDPQIAAVVNFVRGHFSRQPAWADVEGEIRKIRQSRSRP